jgi:GntR family transcriptional regulator
MAGPPRRPKGEKLSAAVAESLRQRLEAGEWGPRERLPSEHELGATYGVSRATVRTALHALDSRGLTVTVHGVGTFATPATRIVSADLHRLESISQTIVRMGREPGSTFRSIAIRPATAREAATLGLKPNDPVVFTQREITADGELVAYSHDALPRDVLAVDFDVRTVTGSLFALLERHGVEVRSSLTEIHASRGAEIGWGDHDDETLFVLLEQAHFDARSRGVAFSRTWFIEGRFQFSLARVR